jgi:hypothetical protein
MKKSEVESHQENRSTNEKNVRMITKEEQTEVSGDNERNTTKGEKILGLNFGVKTHNLMTNK